MPSACPTQTLLHGGQDPVVTRVAIDQDQQLVSPARALDVYDVPLAAERSGLLQQVIDALEGDVR